MKCNCHNGHCKNQGINLNGKEILGILLPIGFVIAIFLGALDFPDKELMIMGVGVALFSVFLVFIDKIGDTGLD